MKCLFLIIISLLFNLFSVGQEQRDCDTAIFDTIRAKFYVELNVSPVYYTDGYSIMQWNLILKAPFDNCKNLGQSLQASYNSDSIYFVPCSTVSSTCWLQKCQQLTDLSRFYFALDINYGPRESRHKLKKNIIKYENARYAVVEATFVVYNTGKNKVLIPAMFGNSSNSQQTWVEKEFAATFVIISVLDFKLARK